MNTEAEVLAAADEIVAAFAAHDSDRYFSLFAEDATFVFYTAADRLNSRSDYEHLWQDWERESDFRVLSCSSHDRRVQLFDGFAVFTHAVTTQLRFDGETSQVHERETIVFHERNGRWLAVHEHLSPIPEP